jgi:hypothetical protein
MIEKIKEILKGIDKDMSEDKKGWWETSTGAGFGAKKLKEIEDLVKLNLLSENQLLKELERLKNESGTYSNNTYFNTGYYTGILDAIDLVKKL